MDDSVHYDCEPMLFLELGSVPHKYYLINFKLPEYLNTSTGVPKLVNQHIGRFEYIHMPGEYILHRYISLNLSLFSKKECRGSVLQGE